MASIGDVAAVLRAVMTMVDEAAQGAKAADDQLETSVSELQNTFYDSSSYLAEEGLGLWSAARERLAEALALLASANETMGRYVASITGGGGAPPPPSSAFGGGGNPPPSDPPSAPPPEPEFDPRRRESRRAESVRRFGWPKRPDGKTSARGMLYDAKGKPVLHAPLKALGGDRVYNTPDLKDEWRSRDMATSWHIEGGAAAYMRSTRTREMALYINLPTCGNNGGFGDDNPKGCHTNLPKILPRGYTLHVHAELENGWSRQWTYRGTGEALKDD